MDKPIFAVDFVKEATKGELISTGTAKHFANVGTDSRKALHGELFVALSGESFDGHDYVASAVSAGASGVLVHRADVLNGIPSTVTQILVPDTLKALQDLAHAWRKHLDPFLLAITGSNGKTSTKEFLHQILARSFNCLKSKGSFNNHWGVPLTLLSLRSEHTHGVIEMGMNHSGEIRQLVKMAQPQVVACTNVGRAHLGNFASPAELAKAKEEIYGPQKGLQMKVFNLDNPWTAAMKDRYVSDHKLLTFSQQDARADVLLQVQGSDAGGLHVSGHLLGRKGQARVPVFGRHQAENLACAAAMALACGLPSDQLWQDLSHCRTTWGRGQWVDTQRGVKVLFDAYNANPDSFLALLENVKELPRGEGQKWWLIASDMLEMGREAPAQHRELGAQLATVGWDGVLFVGQWAQQVGAEIPVEVMFHSLPAYEEKDVATFLKQVAPGDLLVVKGSRGGKLERVVDLLGPICWGPKDG